MKINLRSLHRDLGFFYVGLIIAFAFSGLFLNHRKDWHPKKFSYETTEVTVDKKFQSLPSYTEDIILEITSSQNIGEKLRRFGQEDDDIWISYQDAELEFNSTTGIGTFKRFMVTPVLGQMTILHQSTSKFWIYYSDIFAIAMLCIAISAMLFANGKYGFGQYGWKLMLAGLIFPLIFLFFLY